MSSPSKATTRCQPVLLLPLFNIHRLGWNQRRSDFDNHHLWLLQPKALAFKSRQWLTQAICPSQKKINWNSPREIEGAKVSLKSSGMLNGGTTVQRTSGPLIPPALPQDITVLQKVPAGCLREILMEVCCLLTLSRVVRHFLRFCYWDILQFISMIAMITMMKKAKIVNIWEEEAWSKKEGKKWGFRAPAVKCETWRWLGREGPVDRGAALNIQQQKPTITSKGNW